MGDAVHRLYSVLDPIHLGEVHVLPIILIVARLLPHVNLQYLGPDYKLISSPQVLLSLKIFKEVAQERAIRVVDHETRPHLV